LKKEITLADVKLDKDINSLKIKAQGLLKTYSGYKTKWLGLSLEDVKNYPG